MIAFIPPWIAFLATSCLFAQILATPLVEQPPVERPIPLHVQLREEKRSQWRERYPEDLGGSEAEQHKYFHEPAATDIHGHYDRRYFGGVVTYDQRSNSLHHMIRAYLRFSKDNGLETWIAHGTLLGWWWNGRMLPWDADIDTQVSGRTLSYMANYLNMTTYHYVDESNGIARDYLLDVNPWFFERERGDGMNIIDARWIDVGNGLYVDITGLSETEPDKHPGVWSCKNYHHYPRKDLYPMRESTFEGMPAKIPYAYEKILVDEYAEKALILTEYEGHYWDAERREWVKKLRTGSDHNRPKTPKEPKTVKEKFDFVEDKQN